jgi:hypothetical protein
MNKTNKPDIGVILNRRLFNTLVWVLTQFIGTEKEIGVTELSRNSEKLRFKIMKYARPYSKDNTDCVSIYFFKNEAAVLIEILTSYFSLGKKNIPDFYARLTRTK